jgi:hypothetical protein
VELVNGVDQLALSPFCAFYVAQRKLSYFSTQIQFILQIGEVEILETGVIQIYHKPLRRCDQQKDWSHRASKLSKHEILNVNTNQP